MKQHQDNQLRNGIRNIEEAITEHFGKRCPDHAEGCPTCDTWETWTRMRIRYCYGWFVSCDVKEWPTNDGDDIKFTIVPNQYMHDMTNSIIERINDILIDADVDYPAGRECGHSITYDEDEMRKAILNVLCGTETK